MASDRPHILLDGVRYALVLPDDMTLGEQREFEKIADCGIDKIADLDESWRAAIVVAWMAVSIQRGQANTPISQIVKRLDEMTMEDLQAVWGDVVGQNPPSTSEQPPGSDANENSGAETSAPVSGPTPGNTSRNGSGEPGSDTGSDSDQPTFVVSPPAS